MNTKDYWTKYESNSDVILFLVFFSCHKIFFFRDAEIISTQRDIMPIDMANEHK